MEQRPKLLIFVYGTLKRGLYNHHFCRGYQSVAPGAVRGRLFEMTSRIPVLDIPEEDILARATGDPNLDASIQRSVPMPQSFPEAGKWCHVRGELFVFRDFDKRLADLDALEGFHPRLNRVWYRRVLVTVQLDGGDLAAAWTYIMKPEHGWRDLGANFPCES